MSTSSPSIYLEMSKTALITLLEKSEKKCSQLETEVPRHYFSNTRYQNNTPLFSLACVRSVSPFFCFFSHFGETPAPLYQSTEHKMEQTTIIPRSYILRSIRSQMESLSIIPAIIAFFTLLRIQSCNLLTSITFIAHQFFYPKPVFDEREFGKVSNTAYARATKKGDVTVDRTIV